MNYQITITKNQENPNYKEEMENYQNASQYGRNMDSYPSREIVKNVLQVCLTEEEFKKVKSEIIKIFE